MDRLKTVDESYNGSTAIRVAGYEYNELGQLVDKKLHSTNGGGSYLQSVDYRYNIKGQLTSLNNSALSVDSRNDDTNDVFGMELLYEQTDGSLGNTAYYNGMVSAVKWKTNAPGVASSNERSYRFNYDPLLRLTAANYADPTPGNGWGNVGAFDEKNISYDLNGNILSLQRNAILNGSITAVDDLNYSYDGNRLNNVSDGAGGNYIVFGFKNLTGSGSPYGYADNGNLTIDTKKGLALAYNVLNRTERITITTASGRYIDYTYDAGGTIVRKQAVDNGGVVKTTDYIEGFIYENGALAYFGSSAGRVRNTAGSLKPEYIITDQLGNARVSFEEQNGLAVVRQENSFYPFGLTMPGNAIPTAANKNLYNAGAEWQDDFGDMPDLQQTFYRMYDAALGRFIAVDPVADASESFGTYHYALDNPVMFNDPLGDQVDPMTQTYGGMHGGYGRIGSGPGNHWSDNLGTETGNGQIEANWDYWNGLANLYNSGVLKAVITYKATGNGKLGYWSDSASPSDGTISTYFNSLTNKMEQSINTGGSNSKWNEISINYGDGVPFYKNFVGPSPDINPFVIKGEDGNVLRPLNLVDYMARDHDLGYYLKGATGVKGALFNIDVAKEDRRLAQGAALVLLNGYLGRKDPITNRNLFTDPMQSIWAQGILVVFGSLSTIKLPLKTAQGYINNFRNSYTAAWGSR